MKYLENLNIFLAVQTAVYWGTPANDGYGGFTYADPVEIKVAWYDKTEKFMTAQGNETVSKAYIIVIQDLDLNGYLYLGELTDLSAAEKAAPASVVGAHMIQRLEKIPAVRSTTDFYRAVIL